MIDNIELSNFLKDLIKNRSEEIKKINSTIWEHPELSWEETKAHDLLTNYMESQSGWEVIKSAHCIETAFIAEFKIEGESKTIVSFNAEFDALPEIGHACGHNLIATCSVVAATSTALAMKKYNIPGTVRLFGTPAEELGGGKIKLLKAGAYDDVDVSLMAHGMNADPMALVHTTALTNITVEYFGKEAHAAAFPQLGINALDAIVIAYNAIGVLRQQFTPGDIIHGFIENGGVAANIISPYSKGVFGIRAPSRARLEALKTKAMNCFKAGSIATGCKLKITENYEYLDLVSNKKMSELYRNHMNNSFGYSIPSLEVELKAPVCGASTDQGNISWALPAIHPFFDVPCEEGPHNKKFRDAAGTQEANDSAIRTGIGLALTALDLLQDEKLVEEIKTEWKDSMERLSIEMESFKVATN